MTGAGGDHAAAEREQPGLEHRPCRGEVVGERVDHAVAGAEAAGEEPARRAPPVAPATLGIVDRTRGNEELAELLDWRRVEPTEGRHLLLQRTEIRFACDRKLRDRLA